MHRFLRILLGVLAAVGLIGGTVAINLNYTVREAFPILLSVFIGAGVVAYAILEIRTVYKNKKKEK